ncbi:dihydrofolate reductase family protein [Xanthocytophaga flava]|uniref:dihydrofolate reductase family protein n=1 Tax=Xanthocytophaga flava TaxID=3048013 RepID=UPI0028D7080C|nr:dihydrofolate reductase family protein [Xanthocytophaga flavus]MDJ1467666.1 dihydrofolate reductase family protein [Xanthocytophaga flavus]
MRKLKLQVQLSIDGYIAGPNGEMDWMIWNWDDELNQYVTQLTEPVDLILLGRKLAEGFIDAWASMASNPDTADAGAHKMNDTPKVVFSNTLKEVQWPHTRLAQEDLVTEITKLKSQEGKDIIAYGGATFVSSLIENDLIDEYHLLVNPSALGAGLPIFKDKSNFRLIQSTAFPCGIVALKYQRTPNS